MVKPRIAAFPKARSSSLGKEAVELARSAGLELDDWQANVLDHSLRTRAGKRWASAEVGVNAPRQNGKGAILEARELAGLYLVREPLIIHSAHQFDTSLEAFRRLLALIEDTPDLAREVKRVSRAHGEEGIELRGKRRIRFRTRTKGGGRGFSCDCLMLDEAMFLAEFSHGALLPTISARRNPQVWYAGSAVDQEIHEHSVVFARVRERGMRGDPSLAYFEWSVEGVNPSAVPDDVATAEAAWAQANPALGIRITPEHVGFEQRSMDPRTFAVERLGIGDWPRTDHVSESPIDLDTWLSLADEGSVLQDPICLAFDVSPDRRSSISAAGRNKDGLWHVEVVEDRAGTGWVAERISQRLAELTSSHRPKAVVCDGYGPAASLVPAIEASGVEVTTVTAGEHAQACGRLVDLVEEGAIRHLGSSELTGAIRSARTRPLGDAWAWSRKNSTANISPLVSVTLALSAALTAKSEPDMPLIAWA